MNQILAADAVLPTYDNTNFKFANNNLGDLISQILPSVFTIAGILLLVTLILGGITLLTAAGDQNKIKEGYGKISAGLIGFLIIFISYFVTQLIEVIFGVTIL